MIKALCQLAQSFFYVLPTQSNISSKNKHASSQQNSIIDY